MNSEVGRSLWNLSSKMHICSLPNGDESKSQRLFQSSVKLIQENLFLEANRLIDDASHSRIFSDARPSSMGATPQDRATLITDFNNES